MDFLSKELFTYGNAYGWFTRIKFVDGVYESKQFKFHDDKIKN